MRPKKQSVWSAAALGCGERFSQAEQILSNSNPEARRHGESLRSGDLKNRVTGSSGNRVIRTHTAELTILKRFVSGHDFTACEKKLISKLCVRARPRSCRLSSLNSSPAFRPGRAQHARMAVVPSSLQAALNDKNSIRALAPAAVPAWSTPTLKPL